MHEFKLTIKLDNKNYCNGCLLLDYIYSGNSFHYKCKYKNYPMPLINVTEFQNVTRPEICKENDK